MNSKDQLKQLQEIKNLMELSTRFLSLSGLSGMAAGFFALMGAWFSNYYIRVIYADNIVTLGSEQAYNTGVLHLSITALVVLILAIVSGIFFSSKNSKKKNLPFWNNAAKRLIVNLAIPLLTGAVLVTFLIVKKQVIYIPATTLIFYGLALVNASHNTISDVKFLGIAQLLLGIVSTWFPGIGMYCWMIGFGGFHVVYGFFMYRIYDLKQ